MDVLYAALAERAFAHDDAPLLILDAGRENFASAGTATVDKRDYREIQQAAAVMAAIDLHLARVARPDGDYHAVVDEQVRDFHGRLQIPARVESQVDYQS